jgi:phytoene dehydrogenase-like protein
MTEKDIIIVGGGIAGLYSAYTILKYAPQTSLLVLEKNPKRWLGGRANNENFYGTRIVTGAGVGRKKKDKLLIQLLEELKIPTVEFVAKKKYGSNVKQPLDIMKTVAFLRKMYEQRGKPRGLTFKDFAYPILGDSLYRNFLVSSGYTDYENEDVYETLYHYGFDDLESNWTGLSIPWRILIEKMADKIGWKHIKTLVNVEYIEEKRTNPNESVFIVKTDKNKDT